MIHSTIRASIGHFGARDDQTIRISKFFHEIVEVIEANEAVEAYEVNETAGF